MARSNSIIHTLVLVAGLCCLSIVPVAAQTGSYLAAGQVSGLPRVQPNDNKAPAGELRDGTLHLSLEVSRADWRLETDDGPGLRVAAVSEAGAAPMIPAPLIRVEAGTRLRVTITNRLADEPIAAFGLHSHPAGDVAPVEIEAGESRTVEFEAGEPGTYLYWIREGPEPERDTLADSVEREQLAGAFVVDPVGGSPPDRILVMNIFADPENPTEPSGDWVEGLAINGRSWPFTERMLFEVGDEVRWRVVNASDRVHPMHLHGFFYSVLSRGTATTDTIFAPEDRRLVVTESLLPRTTMLMEWTASRPGRWLFHCHLSFHVTAEIRLPGAREANPEHAHSHMAGLVTGIEVAPGPTDLIRRGEPISVDLFANEYGDRPGYRYGFARDPDFTADSLTDAPGPMLIFHQYQTVDVTVHNRMSIPTGVHWHGLELEAWADGVPDWSASDGRVSPVIEPGESFTYRLALQRPGTFVYHSHLDDIDQLTGGLYGPLLVLPAGKQFDPRTDHVVTWGWNHPHGRSPHQVEMNGRRQQPDGHARVGEQHRFRIINISPAGRISAWLTRDGETVPLTLHAKDGADLPPHQRVQVDMLPRLGVGEAADFTWIPSAPGMYELHVGFATNPEAHHVQRWVVEPR